MLGRGKLLRTPPECRLILGSQLHWLSQSQEVSFPDDKTDRMNLREQLLNALKDLQELQNKCMEKNKRTDKFHFPQSSKQLVTLPKLSQASENSSWHPFFVFFFLEGGGLSMCRSFCSVTASIPKAKGCLSHPSHDSSLTHLTLSTITPFISLTPSPQAPHQPKQSPLKELSRGH